MAEILFLLTFFYANRSPVPNRFLIDHGQYNLTRNFLENNVNKWIEDVDRLFLFAEQAKQRFETGSSENKKLILQALGSDLTLITVKIETTHLQSFHRLEIAGLSSELKNKTPLAGRRSSLF